MKVLITGIDGYIGTRMAPFLMKRGHDITGLDTGFYREGWLYNEVSNYPKVITKDTREVTVKDLKGYDVVIHLADLSNDPLGLHDPKVTYEINYKATVQLAKNAKKANVKRFIYSSSCSAYGISTKDFVNEESKLNPQTPYAECKVLVEKGLRKLADKNFSPVILRNATVFGPSPRMRFDLVVNNLSGLAWTDKAIKMTSDGSPWRPLVHIEDVCLAFACALEAPKKAIHNETFNVGKNGGNYQIKEVAEMVKKIFPQCNISFGKLDGDTRSYKVSFEKINSKLPGFKATKTVTDGAKELKKIFEKVDLTKDQFQGRAFTRLKTLEYLRKTNQIDKNFLWSK